MYKDIICVTRLVPKGRKKWNNTETKILDILGIISINLNYIVFLRCQLHPLMQALKKFKNIFKNNKVADKNPTLSVLH